MLLIHACTPAQEALSPLQNRNSLIVGSELSSLACKFGRGFGAKEKRKGLSLSIFLVLGKSRMARPMACEWWYLCIYQLGKFYSTCTGHIGSTAILRFGFSSQRTQSWVRWIAKNSHCCQAITGSQTASDLNKQNFSNSDNFNLLHVWKIPRLDYNVETQ